MTAIARLARANNLVVRFIIRRMIAKDNGFLHYENQGSRHGWPDDSDQGLKAKTSKKVHRLQWFFDLLGLPVLRNRLLQQAVLVALVNHD